MEITIQKAALSDAELLSELAISAFYETYAAFNTPENMQQYVDENFTREHFEAEITDDKMMCLVAFANDEMAGYVMLKLFSNHEKITANNQIEIARIYVLKKFHQMKIGWQLFNKAASFSKENNFEILWLGVWEKNMKAINFYKKIGLEIFDQHIFMLGDDAQTDYLMKLNL
jgi:ribosomal protein S18 acetylase RimI-like enzyme